MRIAHICPLVGEQPGGSERYVTNLSSHQAENNDVSIYTTTCHREREGTFREGDVTIHRFYSPFKIWNIDTVSFILMHLLKSNAEIYHIHSYLYSVSFQGVLAKLLRQRKGILHLHGGIGPLPYSSGFLKRFVKNAFDASIGSFVIKNCDIVASVSHNDLEYVSSRYKIPPDRLAHLPNAVDVLKFRYEPSIPDTRDPLVLLYIGDFEPWKGLNLILHWLQKKSHYGGRDITMRFVGQGTLETKILENKRILDMKDNGVRIELLGAKPHSEIHRVLKSADALILPSYWEGLPTVLLEAMATGTPVISTPVGDIPRLIQDRITGLLIDRSISSLDAAVSKIIDSEHFLREMTLRARNLVATSYSFSSVSALAEKYYSRVVDYA
ncbi:MAG: glycosyltransferase family 4 protein [Candidatus Thorarchaeota archaeon]